MCAHVYIIIVNLKEISLIDFLAPTVIKCRGIIMHIGKTTVCYYIVIYQKLLGFHCYTPSSNETGSLGGINDKIIYDTTLIGWI